MNKLTRYLQNKSEITKLPFIDFGVSAQSPSSFHTHNSMISNHSYINPFIKIDDLTLTKITSICNTQPIHKVQKQKPRWTTRIHLNNFSHLENQNGFLTGRKPQDQHIAPGLSKSMQFDQSFDQMCSNKQNNKSFHKKKGQFTSYLQNHLLNISFSGPILGDQRSLERKQKTKQEILLKKLQALEKTKQRYSTIKPNRCLSPLLEKTKIHRNRLQMNDHVHQDYKEKQNVRQRSKQFQLPKIRKNQIEQSLNEIKSHYKKFKNQSLSKSYFMSSLSNVKTSEFDKTNLMAKIR